MGSGSSVVRKSRALVIVGGGFAGAGLVSRIVAKKWVRRFKSIVLVDKRSALHHCPSSCRAIVQDGWQNKLFVPYQGLVDAAEKQAAGILRVQHGTVTAVNDGRLDVVNDEGTLTHLDFDVLVLATGSQVPFPGKDDAVTASASKARYAATLAVVKRADRVAVVGGGPVGVELAGEMKFAFPGKDVTLFHSSSELLSRVPVKAAVRAEAAKMLEARGVMLCLGEAVDTDALDAVARDERKADEGLQLPDHVTTGPVMVSTSKGTAWEADVVIRCTGARTNSNCYAVGWLSDAVNEAGQLQVAPTLQVQGHPTVYAIGDCSDVGEMKTMYMALQQGRYVAEVLAKQAMKPDVETKPYATHPAFILLPMGPKSGTGQLPTGQLAAPPVVALGKGKTLLIEETIKLLRAPAKGAA